MDAPLIHSDELTALRHTVDHLPDPAWRMRDDNVVWFNVAYAELYQLVHGHPPRGSTPLFSYGDDKDDAAKRRVKVTRAGEVNPDWFKVVGRATETGEQLYFATNINAVVRAEAAQRNFVQTLAKTFAHLSIGLAIFDRKGQLFLFNPALIDLTGLPADFLSRRPTLMSFFDQLREDRLMPEPKNYATWRQTLNEVIDAAADGRYEETWSLDTGQTYRVKGRPHPDGATAFLFEDISAEVTLTRNFRAELELGQSLMDTLEDALVVFSGTGILTFCNSAYQEMWGVIPDQSFIDHTVADAISVWTRRSHPNLMMLEIEDFVLSFQSRDPWEIPLDLLTGETMTCQISPISAGATLIRFSRVPRMGDPEHISRKRHGQVEG